MSEELKGKDRADLRTAQLKSLLIVWEKQRDDLYDEIAYRKGQVELLEQLIKGSYESILNVNKEEQRKEVEAFITKKPPKGAKTPKKSVRSKNPK